MIFSCSLFLFSIFIQLFLYPLSLSFFAYSSFMLSFSVLGSRPVLILTFPCLGLDLGLELCTKCMGLSFLCLVLISAPLVSNLTLLHSLHTPLLYSPFQCWVQDQSWSRLFLVLVLILVLSYNVHSLWGFHLCAWSWSRHLWSLTQHCSIVCIQLFYVLLFSVWFKTSLDLDLSLSWSWSWAMYEVYGAFILVPCTDLCTSGLEPNTAPFFGYSSSIFSFSVLGSRPVLILTFPCLGLDLGLEL